MTGILETIDHQLLMLERERAARQASPSAAALDSQSVKTTDAGGAAMNAGKKVKGPQAARSRGYHGRAVLQADDASIQDRDEGCRY